MLQVISIIFFEVICCKMFFEIFVEKRKLPLKWLDKTMIPILTGIYYFCAITLSDSLILRQVCTIFLSAFTIYFYFKAHFIKIVIIEVIYQALLLSTDLLGTVILHNFWTVEINSFLENIVGGTVVVLICRMFLLAFILFLGRKWNKKDSLSMLSGDEWVRFLYFPLITIVILVGVAINLSWVKDKTSLNTLLMISFSVVGMDVIVIYVIRDIVARERKIRENHIFREKNKSQMEMYRMVCENFNIQKKKSHEYKNQIGCIEGMLRGGRLEETLQYVSRISGGLDKNLSIIDTNHVIVNAILNTKFMEAREKDIALIFKINDLSAIPFKDEDIVTILSNLLNNAIEACEGNDGDKIIKIKFLDEPDYITISVRNTVFKEVKKSNGKYITNKHNEQEHGIGIDNIKETVEKYHGSHVIKEENGFFDFIILVPRH